MHWLIMLYGYLVLGLGIFSIIKYIYLSKKYPNGLKVFAISVYTYLIFVVLFTAAETYLYAHIELGGKITGKVFLYYVFGVMQFIFLITLYYLSSFRICFYEDYFTYHDILGIKHKILYGEVEELKYNSNSGEYIIKLSKGKIKIPYFIEEASMVEEYIKLK